MVIKLSNSIQSIIIHTSSKGRSPLGKVQKKPKVTDVKGHSVQVIVRCGVDSVGDDSIDNRVEGKTLNSCVYRRVNNNSCTMGKLQ